MIELRLKEKIYSSLRALCFTEQDIQLYVTSLSLGPGPLAELARRLRVSRPTAYKLFTRLEQQGLAKRSAHKHYARAFMVESPIVVLEKARDKRRRCDEIDRDLMPVMTDLLALYAKGLQPTAVRVVEGSDRLRILDDLVIEEEKKEIRSFGATTNFFSSYFSEEECAKWTKKRIRKGVRVKAITPIEEITLSPTDHEAKLREVRILKGVSPYETAIELFSNKVVFWQPKKLIAIVVENEGFVEMISCFFNALWESATPLAQALKERGATPT